MASQINASNSGFGGIVSTGDSSGVLQLQTAGTTAVTIDTSQRAAFVAGTAAAPAITTSGDTNTGIFFPAADTTAFAEGGVEAMRINSSGYVGFGTTNPSGKIHVQGNGLSGYAIFQGSDPNQWITLGGNFNDPVIGYTSTGSLRFGTTTDTVFSGFTERMRIDSSGNVLVGTTSNTPSGGTAKQYNLATGTTVGLGISVNNTGYSLINFFYNNSTLVGTVSTNGTGVTYGTSSDYRLKENVVPMTGALDKVLQLKPVTYKWKSNGLDGQGFIAHELQAIVPDAVVGEKDAVDEEGNPVYQGVDTSFLVATLTAAIQELAKASSEQQTIINDLKARIETLEAK